MNQSVSEQYNIAISTDAIKLGGEQLLSAAKAGDHSAFVELCQPHSKKILQRIYRITKNLEDAEDVLQDALLKAFIHLKDFEGRSRFSSWLTRIAINSALMALRKKRRSDVPIDQGCNDSQMWLAWEPQDQTESPESHCTRREREDMLRDAICRLPSMFREVVELRHVQEYSTRETAQALGISEAAAKSRLLRARMAVRASFSKTIPTSRKHI
jgi:RNA polymerase sigma-70 factor, ECF subfamily